MGEFTQDIEVFFVFQKSLLIVGTATFQMPSHMDRIKIAREENKLKKNHFDAAEFFYPMVEEYLRGVDLKVYQLGKQYKLSDYKKSQEGLELLKHITDHTQVGYYEFVTEFCNQVMEIFGGVRLGKLHAKS